MELPWNPDISIFGIIITFTGHPIFSIFIILALTTIISFVINLGSQLA